MIRPNPTRTLVAVAALAVAATAIPSAYAAPYETETRSKVVTYSDLDLASATGQAQLDARLRRAAGAVCDMASGPHPLAETTLEKRCFADALRNARASYAMARQQPVMVR